MYTVHMSTTITVRTDETLRSRLEERAAAEGKSLSGFVRGVLEEAVVEKPLGDRIGHLRGTLELRRPDAEPWRQRLRERNWRA